MDAIAPRRWTLLDAILVIATTAIALPATMVLVPELLPIVRQIDASRLLDPTYAEQLFHGKMKSARRDTAVIQARAILNPIVDHRKPRWIYIDRRTGEPVTGEEALDNWVRTHSRFGRAIGFALAQDVYFLVFPFLILWSLCLVILRLIPPRPGWRALFRRPGWWASLAPLVAFPVVIFLELHEGYDISSAVVPVSVALAWSALGLIRRWQSEPTWIDRAGRLLGLFWLATIPAYLVGFILADLR